MNKCAESNNNIVPCAAAKTFEIIMFLKMAYFVEQYQTEPNNILASF